MTSERSIERILDAWLAERPTQIADRVLNEVADRIARESQASAWRVYGRDTPVNSYLKPLLAVAAVVAIAVVGWYVLPRDLTTSGDSSPTPSPTLLTPGPLGHGAYRMDAISGLEVRFTVPSEASGWEAGARNFIGRPPFVDPPDGVFLGFNTVTQVPRDACQEHLVPVAVGNSVDDIATVWAALPHAQVVGPAPITVSGFSGVRVELMIDDNLSDCDVEGISLYYAGPTVRLVAAGQHVELWAIDVDGTRLVVEASSFPRSSTSDVTTLEEIVSSIGLQPSS